MKLQTVIWDCETNGLLDTVSRMHVLVLKEVETKRTFVFRNNHAENTLRQGIELLRTADLIVGHNILHYDIPVIEKLFGEFNPEGRIRDTLVLTRMIFADEKQRDFGRFAAGRMPGNLIGNHSLDAWGHRLNQHKGNYKKEMEDQGLDPWAEWNQEMENYCVQDVEVTTTLWDGCKRREFSEEAIVLEHRIHELMGVQERNGFPFDVAAAQKLAVEVEARFYELANEASAHYGSWYAPSRNHQIAPLWEPNEEGGPKRKKGKDKNGKPKKSKEFKTPRSEFGEDDSRAIWADVDIPKVTRARFGSQLFMKDVPYCPVRIKEFNPLSRQNVIDRFTTVYDWEPEEFTDTGQPTVNDDVLRNLIDKIPMAYELAEVYFHKKLLGQLHDGKNGWLKLVSNGKIHPYTNVGGTVSGRASHNSPNIAQVPKVVSGKRVNPDTGMKESYIKLGRDGDYGWECRSLFYVPEGWKLVGCDLSGIEFRCLANMTARYDNGTLIDTVLHGDIHEMNREAAGLPSRDLAKTFIYAYMYGAGDWKLGHTVAPLESDDVKIKMGADLRKTFESRLPALGKAVAEIKAQAARGYLIGLDGRRLYVRNAYSALNLKLQSDGALIAKKWLLIYEDMLLDRGYRHGWDGDFAMLAWIHDETQNAAREEIAPEVAQIAVAAARAAGEYFRFQCPVDAEAKIGTNWAETH